MRALKNWTITAEPIRKGRDGFLSYYQYLICSDGKHKNQSIKNLTGKRSAFNIIRKADAFNLARRLGNGGRPSSYGWSAALSYPFEIDDEIMLIIFQTNMQKFYRYVSNENELDFTDDYIKELIKNETVAITHRGFNKSMKPINNHIHILIQKHFKALKQQNTVQSIISIDLTKKKYLKALKLFNNETISDVLDMELFNYQIKSKQEQKKRQSSTQYEQKKIYEKKISHQVDEATELLDEVIAHIEEYKRWANKNETHNEEVPSLLLRAKQQIKNGNTRRARKTLANYRSPS